MLDRCLVKTERYSRVVEKKCEPIFALEHLKNDVKSEILITYQTVFIGELSILNTPPLICRRIIINYSIKRCQRLDTD